MGCSPWRRWVRHDWATSLSLFTFMHWRRKWQPAPVFLPGESQGRGSLAGCRLRGHTESDTTEVTQQQQQPVVIGGGGFHICKTTREICIRYYYFYHLTKESDMTEWLNTFTFTIILVLQRGAKADTEEGPIGVCCVTAAIHSVTGLQCQLHLYRKWGTPQCLISILLQVELRLMAYQSLFKWEVD